jgi:hypothetical protein
VTRRYIKAKGVRPCVYRLSYKRHRGCVAFAMTNRALFNSLVCALPLGVACMTVVALV